MNELVYLKNDEPVCSSLQVAEKFEKRHANVMRAIDSLVKNDSTQNCVQCFKETTYKDSTGKSNKMYVMNRDGFTFLVMGFTGKKANEWKWQYIKAFNQMEKFIREKQTKTWIETRKAGKLTRKAETDTDIRMNAFGVKVDSELIRGALQVNEQSTILLETEAKEITGLDNPNSSTQLLDWIHKHGVEMDNLQKATVTEKLADDLPDNVRRALEIRQQLGKTSIKKYVAMDVAKGNDDRVRGLTQYYGANRTGRWAGRLVQMQNLPRNYIKSLDYARKLVKAQNYDGIKLLYGNVPDTLSQLIRTAFIPSEGNKFVVADFSAIEARVIAWLAGETWVNEVFATHGKIYEATASQMFHVPIEKIAKGNPEYALRQKGKVATLALGYQGGSNALIAMGALNMGLSEEELPDIVHRWRSANPRIRDLWYAVEEAALAAMQTAQPQAIYNLIFNLESDIVYGQNFLTVQLPSGRKLYYPRPFLKENQFGKMAIHYYTVGQQTRKWEVTSTYGGKMTENIVQAIARDCLAETLRRIDAKGLQVVFHVHDEVIIDAPMDTTVEEICDLMAEPIPWAPGLILKGAGFESNYYMKD